MGPDGKEALLSANKGGGETREMRVVGEEQGYR